MSSQSKPITDGSQAKVAKPQPSKKELKVRQVRNRKIRKSILKGTWNMFRWIGKHPILAFALLTVALCWVCGPQAVGAWYSSGVREAGEGIVAFAQAVIP